MNRFCRGVVYLTICIISFACGPDSKLTPEQKAAEKSLSYLKDDLMSFYYYWNTFVPDVKYTWETDIYEYFYKLLWTGDRWSWMMDGQEYVSMESGVMSGTYGASMAQPWSDPTGYYAEDGNVVVRFVYPNSPFANAGVRRGWTIAAIDGKSTMDYYIDPDPDTVTEEEAAARLREFNDLLNYPSTTQARTFTFVTPTGETLERSIVAAAVLNTRPGLVKKIFTAADYPGLGEKVGYFHYLSFLADEDVLGKSMLDDITEAMDYFKQNNVKTLILDLRYNGGGDSRASNLLVSYLAPASAVGKVYVKRTHNSNLSSRDEEDKVESPDKAIAALEKEGIELSCKPGSPGFERLYVITGKGSASASEMSLNGLKPLSDLTHIGGVTYGKPNGMYVFLYPNLASDRRKYQNGDYSSLQYVFLPICFYNANGLGQNIPDDGITPDFICPDDLYHDFDASEMNIASCLYNIVNGGYPEWETPGSKASGKHRSRGGRLLLNREDYDKNYGRYSLFPDFL